MGTEPAFRLVILGSLFCSFILLETPNFILFLFKFPFKMLKFCPPPKKRKGEAFLLAVGAFLLTVELLCLQFVDVLLRHTFPL